MTSWHAQNHFFPGGLKFNVASVRNNHKNEKKYFECVLGGMVRNITGRATTPDTTVHNYDVVKLCRVKMSLRCVRGNELGSP